MLVLGLDIDYLTEDYRVDLVFACYVEYGHGLPILPGDDNVIVQECAIHREVVVVARRKPEADGICVGGQFGIELVAEVEFLHQSVPCGIRRCFYKRHIDKDGVVDAIVLYERGTDAGVAGIGLIGNAALVEGDGAGPELDDERAEDYQQADGERHRP